MWILPKQLHTSHFVPDTAALISDLAEQSQICEQSLLARSKPSLARTWSQKWKRDSWTQHLSGRILKPSLGQSFVTAWTSSLEVIPASHFQQQGSDSDETTLDTSGLGSQMELELCDPESASLRTSKDTSASDSERSSVNWKALVIKRRGEYSLRVKSAHLTNASECSSGPTISVNESKNSVGKSQLGRNSIPLGTMVQIHGQAAPVSPSTDGSRQESWATPRTGATDNSRPNNKGGIPLGDQARRAEQWGTPRCSMAQDKQEDSGKHRLGEQAQHGTTAKLNPRWVETLMGLPIGWTMPSCSSPLTIAPTNCDCLETESCQPPQPELF